MPGPTCAYDEVTELDWLEQVRALKPMQSGGIFSLRESCPRCTHILTWETQEVVESPGAAVIARMFAKFRVPAALPHTPGEVYVACNCNEPHDRRPSDRLGCGQAGIFDFWSTPPTARPAGSDDALWAQRAQTADLDALAGIQSTAEKWAGSITALTGVFGIIAFVKTPSDVSVLAQSAQHLLFALLLIALVLDAIAIWLAALAAQGSPRKVWNNAADYKRWSRDEAGNAARNLKRSRRFALITLVLLFLSAGVLWSGQPAGPSSALLVTESGSVVCGQPQVGAGNIVGLKPAGSATPVPLTSVTNITTVTTCQ